MADAMTDSKRFIVLEAQTQADQLMDYVEYLTLSQPQLGLKAISRRESANVIYFLIRDMVDERLAHKLGDEGNMEHIAAILFNIPKNKVTKELQARLDHVVNSQIWHSMRINLSKQIGKHIEQGSWTDWTVVKSASLIGLAEGEDHRITEFHKETKALSVDDEAVLTLNCSNPINYLYNEFNRRYGQNVSDLRAMLHHPETNMDDFYRKILIKFLGDPTEFIVGIFLDTLVLLHPQIEIGKHAYSRNPFIERALGIYDMESFQSNVVSKLIGAFGLNWFNHEVKKDQNYYVEYYLGTHVMAIYNKEFTTLTEKYEAELLNAFTRGDFLPYEERVIAERLYTQSAQHVLNLNS